MTLVENALLSGYRRMGLVAAGFIRSGAASRYADTIVERFRVVASSVEAAASSLSGGNLQKFVVGREILQTPGVLVAAQPTWGVDAGAAAAIHQALIDLAANGTAVLVISQDLDELLTLTDRLAVINEGVLSPPLVTHQASIERDRAADGRAARSRAEAARARRAPSMLPRLEPRREPARGVDLADPADRGRAHGRDRLRAVHADGLRPVRGALSLLRLAGAVDLRPGRARDQGDASGPDRRRPGDRLSGGRVEHRRRRAADHRRDRRRRPGALGRGAARAAGCCRRCAAPASWAAWRMPRSRRSSRPASRSTRS